MKKVLSFLLAIIVIAAIICLVYKNKNNSATNNNATSTEQVGSSTTKTPIGATGGKLANPFTFKFTALPEDATTGIPKTKVEIMANNKTYNGGTYTGTCSSIETTSWKLLDGEVTGAICWYAGGGSEVGIFSTADGWSIKVGELDEGSAETTGTRGNFKEIVKVTRS